MTKTFRSRHQFCYCRAYTTGKQQIYIAGYNCILWKSVCTSHIQVYLNFQTQQYMTAEKKGWTQMSTQGRNIFQIPRLLLSCLAVLYIVTTHSCCSLSSHCLISEIFSPPTQREPNFKKRRNHGDYTACLPLHLKKNEIIKHAHIRHNVYAKRSGMLNWVHMQTHTYTHTPGHDHGILPLPPFGGGRMDAATHNALGGLRSRVTQTLYKLFQTC